MQKKFVLAAFLLCGTLTACDESSGGNGSCGSSVSRPKIIGGNVDTNNQFQSVFYFETNEFVCTGVKVASDLLLTAAHCILDTNFGVISGKISLTNQNIINRLENATIKEIVIEPKFNTCIQTKKKFEDCQEADSGDLAFIRLTPEKNGQFVSAASQNSLLEPAADNSVLTFTGYGCETRQDDRAGTASTEPRKKFGTRQSNDFYTSAEFGFSKSYFAVFFPANTSDAAICAGDSGAPSYIQQNGNYLIAGITSFNAESEDQSSGIDGFVNLSYFKSFITDEIAKSPARAVGESCQ